MSKIEKALEKKADERATFENGRIYKRILEVIIIVTNIIYVISFCFGKTSFDHTIMRLMIELIMCTINLSTFIGVLKTAKIGTFEGSINKITYELSTLHILNIYGIVDYIIRLLFPENIQTLGTYLFLIGVPVSFLIILAESIYLNKKIKQA